MSAKNVITAYKPRLQTAFETEIRGQLKDDLKLGNINEVPRLTKVVVSVGLGRGKDDKRQMEAAANTLAKITGQKAVPTKARKSIASFKLREGQVVGMKVTLRGQHMYEFVDRLINVVLPRLRDFHGVPASSFDSQANYNLGLVDQSIFPELSFEETSVAHGIEVTLVTTAKDSSQGQKLLEKMGMPFSKEGAA